MKIKEFFDPRTSTLTYVVWDETTKDAVVIDPVLDFDPADGRIWTDSSDVVVDYLRNAGLRLHNILETHAHADHLSGAQVVKKAFPAARVAIGDQITQVQEVFAKLFNFEMKTDGSQFDRLLKDRETFEAGSLAIRVIATPGHTPACSSYLIEDALFTGDAIFMPDSGTGRCDFPKGDAKILFHSVSEKIYGLPDSTRIFVGHDYQPQGRPLQFETTVADQKEKNIHITKNTTEEKFVQFRKDRDRTLTAPRLLLPSIQVNIDAGRLPNPEKNGLSYLKIPLSSRGDITL